MTFHVYNHIQAVCDAAQKILNLAYFTFNLLCYSPAIHYYYLKKY